MAFEHLTFVELHVHEADEGAETPTQPDTSREAEPRRTTRDRIPVAKIAAAVGVSVGVSIAVTLAVRKVKARFTADEESAETEEAVVEITG